MFITLQNIFSMIWTYLSLVLSAQKCYFHYWIIYFLPQAKEIYLLSIWNGEDSTHQLFNHKDGYISEKLYCWVKTATGAEQSWQEKWPRCSDQAQQRPGTAVFCRMEEPLKTRPLHAGSVKQAQVSGLYCQTALSNVVFLPCFWIEEFVNPFFA